MIHFDRERYIAKLKDGGIPEAEALAFADAFEHAISGRAEPMRPRGALSVMGDVLKRFGNGTRRHGA